MKRCNQCQRPFIENETTVNLGGLVFCGNICVTNYCTPKPFNLKKFREGQGGDYGTDMEDEGKGRE